MPDEHEETADVPDSATAARLAPGQQLAYWKAQLADAPAALELPLDRSRPARKGERRARAPLALPSGLGAAVSAFAAREDVTSHGVLLAAFAMLLARHTGQTDVVIGGGSNVEPLPLRLALHGEPTFHDVVDRAMAALLGAADHDDVSVQQIAAALGLEQDASRAPLFQVVLTHQDEHDHEASRALTGFDLVLSLETRGDELGGTLAYDVDLFDASTAARIAERYGVLLEAALQRPSERAATLPVMTDAERERVLVTWNATASAHAREQTVHGMFEAQVDRSPDAVAVTFAETRVTYRELDERANRVAHWLLAHGVRVGDRVALEIGRSHDMVSAVLGVMKAGGAYVPIDPTLPDDRRAFMKADADATIVLDDLRLAAAVSGSDRGGAVRPVVAVAPHELAYVLYTSGSTGRPKGVMVEHRNVSNLLVSLAYEPGIASSEITLSLTTLSFDVSVAELLLPLVFGAEVVVGTREDARDPALIAALIEKTGARTFGGTPATWRMMVDAGWRPDPGMEIHCAGEALPRELADALVERGAVLWNLYGPTEATVYASGVEARRGERITIGRPLRNTQLYVVDALLQPVPIGVAGELCIGGEGVARGYLGKPELTAEKFVRDPFAPELGARMYRTGDLARWLPSGEVEYLGRLDHQVKIRGYRIELGEIESVLALCEGVRTAVVLAREDVPGDKRLVAYVIAKADEAFDPERARQTLAQKLPEYMIPSAFVELAALPVNATGKIDRRALPAPDFSAAGATYRAPGTPTERALAQIWCQLLRIDRVGVDDDFFRLGGHSLLATRVVSHVRSVLHVAVPLRAVFEADTLGALARSIDALEKVTEESPLSRVQRRGPIPASSAQARLWFLDQLSPGSNSYNVPLALRLDGELDADVLERAIAELVLRHEPLRTTFRAIDGRPHQVIDRSVTFRLRRERASSSAALDALIREMVRAPFDLAAGPVMRAMLVSSHDDPRGHVLVLCIHHIATDGWSMGVLLRELSVLYDAFARGAPSPLPPLPVEYADFAVWRASALVGPELAGELGFWKDVLEGAPRTLDLPTDRPRPPVRALRGGSVPVHIPRETADGIRALGRRDAATPFMILLAAYQAVLSRWSGQDDIVVGAAVANRPREELEGLVGFFVNTLPLRTKLDGAPTFAEVVRRVKQTCLAAYAHQDVQFEQIVDALAAPREPHTTPVFQAMFALQDAANDHLVLDGITVHDEPSGFASAKFDLTLSLGEAADGMRGELEYDKALFDRSTMTRFAEHLGVFLEAAVRAPEERVALLPLMTEVERQRVVVEWNATARIQPRIPRIDVLFAEQARAGPDRIALSMSGRKMTYADLDARSSALAHRLRAHGVGPEVMVGITTTRSFDLVVGLLAILKAGGAYVPFDPSHPAERAAILADEAGVHLVLDPGGELSLPAGVIRVGADDASTPTPMVERALDDLALSPRDAAYVLFTSGSTGRPKGVIVEHRSVVRLVRETDVATFTPADVCLLNAPLAFDASTLEIWGPLLGGARLAIAPPGVSGIAELGGIIAAEQVTFLWLTSALFQQFVEHGLGSLGSVRELFAGGDVLSVAHVERVRRDAPRVRLVNGYGPTENTTFTTCHEIHEVVPGKSIPIGRPIANTTTYVLDAHGRPAPIGVVGELYTGGLGVARGYIQRPALTAEKFVPDPFSDEPDARLYRTGDLVRWLADGNLELVGRADQQVKIRGFRIELGEIEASLSAVNGVEHCVVVAREERAGDKRLVAYVVPANGVELAVGALRQALAVTLPDYMLPSAFVIMTALPVSTNGKVDRKALPAPEYRGGDAEYVAPLTPTAVDVAAIWQEVLMVERVSMTDNFFMLGGHSLLATQVVARLLLRLAVDLPVRVMFETRTLADLVQHVAAAPRVTPDDDSPPSSKMVRRRAL